LLDLFEFFGREPVFPDEFGSQAQGRRGGHIGKFYCRICRGRRKGCFQGDVMSMLRKPGTLLQAAASMPASPPLQGDPQRILE
jgi:hypothetical protein